MKIGLGSTKNPTLVTDLNLNYMPKFKFFF